MNGFAEKRKLLLEVIDDMAKAEVENARLLDQGPEAIPDPEMDATTDDGELAPLPEAFREHVEELSDEELLQRRRVAAKAVCQLVCEVGYLHFGRIHELVLATIERLRTIDIEVVGRHLVAD